MSGVGGLELVYTNYCSTGVERSESAPMYYRISAL